MPLTVQIITKNNAATVENTLKSVLPLDPQIVIFDQGSTDETTAICEHFGAEVIKSKEEDRSKLRNSLTDDWQMYLEPWETLLNGADEINKQINKSGCFQIFRGDVLTKEVRLWQPKKLQFRNPVFECLIDDEADLLNVFVNSPPVAAYAEKMKLVHRWKERKPTAAEPYYYEACLHLAQRNVDEFLKAANQYLFRDSKKIMPITMTRYYCALIYYQKRDAANAIKYILTCLIAEPLMAEFWCLLGDVYFFILKKYTKAHDFYDNALELGAKRLKTDRWPMELSKYREYPKEMKSQCEKIISTSGYWGAVVP